jgi:hypothetical protein
MRYAPDFVFRGTRSTIADAHAPATTAPRIDTGNSRGIGLGRDGPKLFAAAEKGQALDRRTNAIPHRRGDPAVRTWNIGESRWLRLAKDPTQLGRRDRAAQLRSEMLHACDSSISSDDLRAFKE